MEIQRRVLELNSKKHVFHVYSHIWQVADILDPVAKFVVCVKAEVASFQKMYALRGVRF